jgi:starch phosphorylase
MAENAFELLEQVIVPEFYDRDPGGIPRRWVAGIKRSLASLGWQVSSAPMVRAYERLYREAARASDPGSAGD